MKGLLGGVDGEENDGKHGPNIRYEPVKLCNVQTFEYTFYLL